MLIYADMCNVQYNFLCFNCFRDLSGLHDLTDNGPGKLHLDSVLEFLASDVYAFNLNPMSSLASSKVSHRERSWSICALQLSLASL